MESRRTERLGAIITTGIFALLAVLIVLSAYRLQHIDTDIFWALKSGEWITANWKVPATDPFSYTFEGREWVDFTWGFQVIAHFFYTALGGWIGIFVLQVLVTGATFALIYINIRLFSPGRAWLAATLLLAVLASSYTRLFIRPHLFAYLFLSAYFLLLNLYEREGSVKYLAALFPLQALWVNIHSSSILGVFLVGAYTAGGVMDVFLNLGIKGRFKEKVVFQTPLKMLVAASIAVPLASLINPYGLKLAIFPFIHQAADKKDALFHINEWVRIPVSELLLYFPPKPLDFLVFRVLLYASFVMLILNFRRIRTRDLIILAAAFYMASSHARWVPLFAFFAAPVIAANLSCYLDMKDKIGGRAGVGFKWGFIATGMIIAALLIPHYTERKARENYGTGIKSGVFPEGTVEFMNREKLKGNMFNEYIYGGYLIYNYPHSKVFIDGRTPTVYSPYFFWTSRLVENEKMWEKLVSEHGIDMALIKITAKHCGDLWKDPEWSAVSFDDVSILFLKDKPAFRDVIDRRRFKVFNPCANEARYALPGGKAGLLALRDEIIEYMAPERGGARYARTHRLLGLVYSELGDGYMEEAVEEFRKADMIKGDRFTSYDLGRALARLGRYDTAIEAMRAAVKRDKEFKEAYLELGFYYYETKDYEDAVKTLEKYFILADDASVNSAYKTHGMANFNIGRFASAEASLKRAAYTTEDSKELAEIHYYLGNTLFEMSRYADGAIHYSLAIKADAGYGTVLKELAAGLERDGRVEPAKRLLELLTLHTSGAPAGPRPGVSSPVTIKTPV